MEQTLKELKGHSGSKVFLMQDTEKVFVRKIGNVARNYERLMSLQGIVSVPEIYKYENDILDMEYIHGLDMATYLSYHNPSDLIKFLIQSILVLPVQHNSVSFDTVIKAKLGVANIDWNSLGFVASDLISRFEGRQFPLTNYLGDLTLENILYDTKTNRFVFIDLITSEYTSYVFDLAKLNQDLECKWFIRQKSVNLDDKLLTIKQALAREFPLIACRDLTILMLLRVLPYCKNNSDKLYITNEVKRLWM